MVWSAIEQELRRVSRREPFIMQTEAQALRSAVVPMTAEHLAYLAPRVRIFDEEAVCAHLGVTAGRMLEESYRASVLAWAGLVDGLPICAFGLQVASLTADTAVPWLIATPDVQRYRRIFWRNSREVVALMLDRYPRLVALCQANYGASRRWLERLGFVALPAGEFESVDGRISPKASRPGIRFITLHLTRN